MIKPLLQAGLAVLILGSATAAHADRGVRNDRYSYGRSGCESHSRSHSSRDGDWSRSHSRYHSSSRYGASRYGYAERERWNDRQDEFHDRGHARSNSRDDDRYEREWEERADARDEDRFEPEVAPVRPRQDVTPRANPAPSSPRRSPAGTRRPAL